MPGIEREKGHWSGEGNREGGWPAGFDWRRWWVGTDGALGDGEKR